MSTDEFIKELEEETKLMANIKSFFPCISGVHALHMERVYERGIKSNDTMIGVYTSPSYVELRQKKGRETSFVNLRFTEQLKIDMTTSLVKDGNTYVMGVKNAANANKVGWIEERYGDDVYGHNSKELKILDECISKKVQDILE